MNGRRRRRGKGGGVLRLDDDGDVPAVNSDGEGADEDGDATATTMATTPSDGDDWSDGKARLERRRRLRHEVSRGEGSTGDERRRRGWRRVEETPGILLKGLEGGGEGPRRPATRRKDRGSERETDPNRPRIKHFPSEISRRFHKRKGRGDPEDCFPSIDFTGEGKDRPNWKAAAAARR
jgi:hypothetical protein